MSDTYKNKYNMVFCEGSNPTVINDAHIEVKGNLNMSGLGQTVKNQVNNTASAATVKEENPLDSEAAWALWRKAQRAGWVDADRKPLLSEPQMAMIGSAMRHILGLKWKPFEDFWGIDALGNKLTRAQGYSYYADFDKDITEVFGLV